ncbi:anti-sigma-K factor RskA [Crossiella equi]|uniref:Regulator of SigK n=1 Tax=Crossiella equi TaxID=130796 RepID=A0ABS5AMV5_9PSEU|nr:anti-sigma factor [Crossiella equi]MBP2477572.1 anti-sigma-K factor RskA [Crossiella equi]
MSTDFRGQDCPSEDLATGWALHVLEPAEEAEFAAHLPTCARCQEVVQATEEVGALLGGALPPEEPPPHLRANLFARIDQLEQPGTRSEGHSGGIAEVLPRVAERQAVVEISKRRRRFQPLLAVAAAVLAVAVIGTLGVRTYQLDAEREAGLRREQVLAQAVRIVADPNTRRVVLGAKDGGHPVATVVAADTRAVVVPTDLAPNDTTARTYVLWGLDSGGAPRPLGVFDVNGPDAAPGAVSWPDNAPRFTGYAVSLENGRVAPAAPSTVVGLGNLESS